MFAWAERHAHAKTQTPNHMNNPKWFFFHFFCSSLSVTALSVISVIRSGLRHFFYFSSHSNAMNSWQHQMARGEEVKKKISIFVYDDHLSCVLLCFAKPMTYHINNSCCNGTFTKQYTFWNIFYLAEANGDFYCLGNGSTYDRKVAYVLIKVRQGNGERPTEWCGGRAVNIMAYILAME